MVIATDIIEELQAAVRQRGNITREQAEYARIELQTIKELHPMHKPSEEIRDSYNRTLRRYIGDQAVEMIVTNRRTATF